jgi:hypothetical protein
MLRRRFALLLAAGLTTASCGSSVGLDGPQDAPLVEVLTASVAAGMPVALRMRNASSTAWGYNGCSSPRLQRRAGDAWVDAPESLALCTLELTALGPGAIRNVTVEVPIGYDAGLYRIGYRFIRSDGVEAFAVTGSFTVE